MLAHIAEVLRPDYRAWVGCYLNSPTEEKVARTTEVVTARVKAWAELLRSALS